MFRFMCEKSRVAEVTNSDFSHPGVTMRVCLDPQARSVLMQWGIQFHQEMALNHPHVYSGFCACHPQASRRGFLQSLAGIGAVGALGTSGCASVMAPPKQHRIAVHHHLSPPEWVTALKKAKLDTPPVNNWTPQKSLDDMDQAGIATSMTSPTLPATTASYSSLRRPSMTMSSRAAAWRPPRGEPAGAHR